MITAPGPMCPWHGLSDEATVNHLYTCVRFIDGIDPPENDKSQVVAQEKKTVIKKENPQSFCFTLL